MRTHNLKPGTLHQIDWQLRKFDDLNPNELYRILHLRSEVFVVEQDCVYQDMDFLDQKSIHLFGFLNHSMVAYARIIPPGIKYDDASIGRIVTPIAERNNGYGKAVVEKAIDHCKSSYPSSSIRISAQCYLDGFYQSFGFRTVSDVYLEDGIDHQEMLLEI